jgi:hypothetical protein
MKTKKMKRVSHQVVGAEDRKCIHPKEEQSIGTGTKKQKKDILYHVYPSLKRMQGGIFMSMPEIKTSHCPVSYEQAVNDIIGSIALEEAALAHILNAEGEKIQRIVNDKCASVGAILEVNSAVNETIKNVIKMQMLLQFKLEDAKKLVDEEPDEG